MIDAVRQDFSSAVEANLSRSLKHMSLWPCKLVAESTDGTCDVVCDDAEEMGGFEGIKRVPLDHGIPGATMRLPTGTRLLLGFKNADPQRPFVKLNSDGSDLRQGSPTPTIVLEGNATMRIEVPAGAHLQIEASGTGRVTVKGSDVRLGNAPAQGVARIGDVSTGNVVLNSVGTAALATAAAAGPEASAVVTALNTIFLAGAGNVAVTTVVSGNANVTA